MSNIVWPSSLPQRPTVGGYQERFANTVLRTAMETGAAKTRRRFTAVPRQIEVTFRVNAAQASTERGLRKKIGLTPRDFVTYKLQMIELRQTKIFTEWLDGLSDQHATARIAQRLVRLQSGLFGDVKPVGQGLSELRIDYGPGVSRLFLTAGSGSDHFVVRRGQRQSAA